MPPDRLWATAAQWTIALPFPLELLAKAGALKHRALRVRFSCNEACFVRASVRLRGKTVGTATDSIGRAGTGRLRIRLTGAGRTARTSKLTLRLTARDRAGNTRSLSLPLNPPASA